MGKYHLYLSEEERQLVLHALIDFRNKLIAAGRYTDCVDELLIKVMYAKTKKIKMILSRLVDTFISRISLTMLPVPKPHNTACVLSWEEARRWQSRSSGYSSS